jgi:hypothetical protein
MNLLKLIIATFLNLGCCTLFAQVNTTTDTSKSDYYFQAVDVEASYPGGNEAWNKFLARSLNSNVPNKNNAPIGKYTVYVIFIVDKDGSVSSVRAQTNFGFGMEDEVIRVIEKSGKWNAALQNGKPVKAFRRQPITFVLDSDGFQITTQEPYTLFANTDNEVTVSVKKIKPADISISVQGGKASLLSEGRFNVRVNKPGRVTITITNNKKDDKEIGTASFEVKAK